MTLERGFSKYNGSTTILAALLTAHSNHGHARHPGMQVDITITISPSSPRIIRPQGQGYMYGTIFFGPCREA